jgi:hypothetical protein
MFLGFGGQGFHINLDRVEQTASLQDRKQAVVLLPVPGITGLLLQPEEAVVPLPGILLTAITAVTLAVVRSRVQTRQLQESLLAMQHADKEGRTSLQRMQAGDPPLGKDGKAINLHHINQKDQGALVELEQATHQENSKQLHINSGSGIPSGIDRVRFARFKKQYWKIRAKDFIK